MRKKIYVLALALMLALSMNALAGPETKRCDKAGAQTCEMKDACCKKDGSCDKAKCDKECDKNCEKKCDKKAGKKAA
jgi:hypothetical protein